MSQDTEKIALLSAQFRDPATEAAYLTSVRDRHERQNTIGILIALTLYSAYSIYDLHYYDDPLVPVGIRGCVTALCLLMLWGRRFWRSTDGHQSIFVLIVLVLSSGLVASMGLLPNQYDKLYLGLMQGAILFGFFLRVNFLRMAAAFAFIFVAFTTTIFAIVPADEAALRTTTVASVILISLGGVYIQQLYHRRDFLQARTIDRQNAELAEHLAFVEQENSRRLAALNLLVHFVRTPIHQISGFTDVVIATLRNDDAEVDTSGVLTSAQYIKEASSSLSANVAKLLEYHRLEERKGGGELSPVDLTEVISDSFEQDISEDLTLNVSDDVEISTFADALIQAVNAMASYLRSLRAPGVTAEVILSRTSRGAEVRFDVAGAALSDEDFAQQSIPLTEIKSYLGAGGQSMPMDLRIVARAVAICGGRMGHQATPAGFTLTVSLPNLADTSSIAA